VQKSPEGLAYLNLGCGSHFFKEWNNLDRSGGEPVVRHDLRRPLPYPDNTFAAVYSSHVLEHLTPAQGKSLVREIHRVLAPGGVCRLAVPDLEQICKEYLNRLAAGISQPSETNIRRYRWMTLELLDQLVRDKPGGLMLELLKKGEADAAFVKERCGDEFAEFFKPPGPPGPKEKEAAPFYRKMASKLTHPRGLWQALKSRLEAAPEPRHTGEAHRWMYDRLSLELLLNEAGFVDFEVKNFQDSDIPYWDRYNLDRSASGNFPRKPDSIYVEGKKPL
jgi:predicted SAM-dependent methyltransferase